MEIMHVEKTEEVIKEFYNTMMLSYAKHTLTYDELHNEIDNENIRLLPVFKDNEMAATASFFIEKFDAQNNPYYGSVHRLTVNPKFRNLGIGTSVNKNVLRYAAQIGCKHIYCSVLINTEGIGGGNNPNLNELNICINKLFYKPTGYRLVDLPDFSRINDLQFTSTMVLWKQIDEQGDSNLYELALQNLTNYYNNPNNFELLNTLSNKLRIYPPKKTGAILASSTNIDDFSGTEFLPSYFLPFYSDGQETVYFGFRYNKIMTRTSNGNNIADINYDKLSNQLNNDLLIRMLSNLQEKIAQRSEIVYSDPKIKERNI